MLGQHFEQMKHVLARQRTGLDMVERPNLLHHVDPLLLGDLPLVLQVCPVSN